MPVLPTDTTITYRQAALLGLLQGLTEFLPVSSTALMAIAPQLLFGMRDPGATFAAVVQLGPIIAIIAYFRQDLASYLQGVLRTRLPMRVPQEDTDARLWVVYPAWYLSTCLIWAAAGEED